MIRFLFFVFLLVLNAAQAKMHTAKRVLIPAGRFSPLYGLDKLQVFFEVKSFEIDRLPVTYQEFEKFLKAQPEWTKKKVFALYVDENYLANWTSPHKFRALPDAAVTNVSWYAAMAYCEYRNGRLPTTLEWELVAAASETERDASKKPEFNRKILDWYSKPKPDQSKRVGQTAANFYGVHDLHGLIWEWTSDFNTFFVASDNRSDGDKSKEMFCGAGSIAANDRENYAAFMRYAHRSSLQARYSTENLGFRCAFQ